MPVLVLHRRRRHGHRRGHRRRHHRCQLRQVSWRGGRHRLQLLLPLASLNIGKWDEGDLMLLLEKLRLRVLRRRHMGKDFIGPAFHLRSCRCRRCRHRRPATRQFIPGSRTPIGLLFEDGHICVFPFSWWSRLVSAKAWRSCLIPQHHQIAINLQVTCGRVKEPCACDAGYRGSGSSILWVSIGSALTMTMTPWLGVRLSACPVRRSDHLIMNAFAVPMVVFDVGSGRLF